MAGPISNPLNMDFIVDLVLDYVETPLLLPCRLVNHTWNRLAAARMKKAGWVIHLTSERLKEYLRILKTTERDRGGAAEAPVFTQRARMDLSLHLRISPDSRGMKELDTAYKIVRHTEAPTIVSLELEYVKTDNNSEPNEFEGFRVQELISLIGDGGSVNQLAIRLSEGQGDNVDWILSALPTHINVFCPNLEAISVECKSSSIALLVPEVIDQVVRVANESTLRRLNLFPNSRMTDMTSRLTEPTFGLHTTTLLSLTTCHNLRSSLLELNLHLGGALNLLRFIDTLRFDQLRILRVSSGLTGRVLTFVHTNCPMLNTLEFVDACIGPENELQELPSLTTLGFYRCYDPRLPPNDQGFNLMFLTTMEYCPNITNVITNFSTWVELANWFARRIDGNVDIDGQAQGLQLVRLPAHFQREWPTVSTLTVEIPASSMFPDPDDSRMHTICFLVRRMFPNLRKLVIKLGMESEIETPMLLGGESNQGTLGYAFGLALGVPSLKHVEIKNVHNQWHVAPALSLGWPRDVPMVPPPQSTLETLTIQAVPKSYHGAGAASRHEAPPELDLDALVSVLPQECPALVLRIDARLLLNFRQYNHTDYEHRRPIYPHRPYKQLVEDLKTRTNPRIQLI